MEDRNCLSYWFPLIQAAGLPVPITEIVRTDANLSLLLDGATPAGFDDLICRLESAIDCIGGTPCFLRTGQGSGKHQWKETCYISPKSNLAQHVFALVEWSAMVDMLGLATNVWAVRELLPTVPLGVCPRYGDMPVCREFRFFVRDGKVECWHGYWPKESLEQGGCAEVEQPGWYERLCEPGAELANLVCMAAAAGKAVGGGYWSVDLLETRNGWYLTDMAVSDRSFHWPECEHCPEEHRGHHAKRHGPTVADQLVRKE